MRLKATPEDFVVREAVDLRIRKKPAPYRVYMLEKKGWNSADAIAAIARAKRVSPSRFRYGGKKDRYGHTYQYVTVEHSADLSLATEGYRFTAMGYTDEPIAPGRVLTNHFEVTVRELTDELAVRMRAGADRVAAEGFPNYFDDQRFGSYDPERGFIAEQMLRGRWEEALAIALTYAYPGEKREAKERKRLLHENWGDWEACRSLAKSAFEQRSFDLLREHPDHFRQAVSTARREDLEMWVSAYQSFLWNEMLRRLIGAGAEVGGAAGPYRFAPPTPALQEMRLPLPGRGMRFPDAETGLLFEEIMRERRLRPGLLEGELLPGLQAKAYPREAWVKLRSIHAEGPQPDERYEGHQKLTLRFTLPRGSYATMLIKALGL